MSEITLTKHLLQLDQGAFAAATNHAWLQAAGRGQVPEDAMLQWLTQDRLYALSYVNFIGSLLAKVSVPTASDRETTLEWRICNILIDALVNIRREIGMFESILRSEYGWQSKGEEDTDAVMSTRAYQALFSAASSASSSLLVGLTALWATEKCYLESWRYAGSQRSVVGNSKSDDVLARTLIPNWTSQEFVDFVEALATLVDEYAVRDDITTATKSGCEAIWRQILWAEEQFWPQVQ